MDCFLLSTPAMRYKTQFLLFLFRAEYLLEKTMETKQFLFLDINENRTPVRRTNSEAIMDEVVYLFAQKNQK